jgi:hypothetical protein
VKTKRERRKGEADAEGEDRTIMGEKIANNFSTIAFECK